MEGGDGAATSGEWEEEDEVSGLLEDGPAEVKTGRKKASKEKRDKPARHDFFPGILQFPEK